MRHAALLLSAAVALAGCGGGDEDTGSAAPPTSAPTVAATTKAAEPPLPGCAPLCLQPNLTRPGRLPAGEFTSRYFFGGRLKAKVGPGWESTEDSTGELRFARSGDSEYGVMLWEDIYPIRQGERVAGVKPTAAGLVDWLRQSLDLDLTEPKDGKLGDLPATVVDMSVSAEATNDDPGCPARLCVNPFRFPQWDGPYGIAGDAVTRLLLTDVRYGGRRHLLVAAIEGTSRADLERRLPAAERLLETVRVPAEPA